MISQTAEYALRAVVQLATHCAAEGDVQLTTQQLAAATQVPAGYLSKVLQSLSRAGLINSQRGLGGGFRLARLPQDITIYEVIEAVDPLPRIHTCPLNLASHQIRLCPLHRCLDEAMAQVEQTFAASHISDLIEEPAPFLDPPTA